MILKSDCRHFPGDRPCHFNKNEGLKCDNCPHYEVASARILIIKLESVGDVLRTTCILNGLNEKHPNSEITWITRKDSEDLFKNNTYVDRVIPYESTEAIVHLSVEEFDLVINLDSSPDSTALASMAKGKKKMGYGLDKNGDVFPFNPAAAAWFEMGAFDELKKKNKRSFQDLMLEICELKTGNKDIILKLSPQEMEFARLFERKNNIPEKTPKIGLNTGASSRWQLKQWTVDGFEALIRILIDKTNATILLYGGPREKERNEYLCKIHPGRIIHTGTENSLRQFFALVSISDIFITADTLALHTATALKKNTIAVFGPTSAAEIDDYSGQVTKVQAGLDCLVCYKTRCDFEPNCMNSITPEQLFAHINRYLK